MFVCRHQVSKNPSADTFIWLPPMDSYIQSTENNSAKLFVYFKYLISTFSRHRLDLDGLAQIQKCIAWLGCSCPVSYHIFGPNKVHGKNVAKFSDKGTKNKPCIPAPRNVARTGTLVLGSSMPSPALHHLPSTSTFSLAKAYAAHNLTKEITTFSKIVLQIESQFCVISWDQSFGVDKENR